MIEKYLLIQALMFGLFSLLTSLFRTKFMQGLSLSALAMSYIMTLIAVIVILGG